MDDKIRLKLQQALRKVNKVYCMVNFFEITYNAWLSEKCKEEFNLLLPTEAQYLGH